MNEISIYIGKLCLWFILSPKAKYGRLGFSRFAYWPQLEAYKESFFSLKYERLKRLRIYRTRSGLKLGGHADIYQKPYLRQDLTTKSIN